VTDQDALKRRRRELRANRRKSRRKIIVARRRQARDEDVCRWCNNEGGARLTETNAGKCPACGRL